MGKMYLVVILVLFCVGDLVESSVNTGQSHSFKAKKKGHGSVQHGVHHVKSRKAGFNEGVLSLESSLEDEGWHQDVIAPGLSNIKRKRRDNKDKNYNSMLELESAQTFQNAIETDMDDLNNPTNVAAAMARRRSDTPFPNGHHEESSTSEPTNATQNQDWGLLVGKDNHSSVLVVPTVNTAAAAPAAPGLEFGLGSNAPEMTQAFELLSRTAQHYSASILDEMRIITANTEDVGYTNKSCDHQRNSTSNCPPPEDATKNNNGTATDNGGERTPLSCGPWSEWGACSDSCANGTSLRYRDCYDFKGNKEPEHQAKPCFNPACISCSEWSRWSSCSKICGVGVKYRERLCLLRNGTTYSEKKKDSCNLHPCKSECGQWSNWSECSKPCDSGVSVRWRNCSLPDSSTRVFYEHRVCNTQPCIHTDNTTTTTTTSVMQSALDKADVSSSREDCTVSYFSFDKFQAKTNTIYDESDRQGGAEMKSLVMFQGNYSCGYSALFGNQNSVMELYQDIFAEFEKEDIGISMWVYFTPHKSSSPPATQSLFHLHSTFYDSNQYTLEALSDLRLSFSVKNVAENAFINGKTFQGLKEGNWHHIYVAFRSSNRSLDLRIDGKRMQLMQNLVEYTPMYPTFLPATEPHTTLQFQGFGNSPTLDQPFYGLMDEIYIFKCLLENQEIDAVANACRYRNPDIECPSPLMGLCSSCPPCKPGWQQDMVTPLPNAATPLYLSEAKSTRR